MLPGTGSETLDVLLQIALLGALIATLVLLIKNYRDR